MKVRLKTDTTQEHWASNFNPTGLGEVIVHFNDASMHSVFVEDLDVYIDSKDEWIDMVEAFRTKQIIPDNYDLRFREPKDKEEQKKGFYQ